MQWFDDNIHLQLSPLLHCYYKFGDLNILGGGILGMWYGVLGKILVEQQSYNSSVKYHDVRTIETSQNQTG